METCFLFLLSPRSRKVKIKISNLPLLFFFVALSQNCTETALVFAPSVKCEKTLCFSRLWQCYLFFLGLTEIVSSIFFRDTRLILVSQGCLSPFLYFLDCYSGSRVEISLPKEIAPGGCELFCSFSDRLPLYLEDFLAKLTGLSLAAASSISVFA